MSSPCRISFLLLGLVAWGGSRATAQSTPSARTYPTIEVTGTASVSVPADVARVSFAVETHAKEAGAASADNAEIMSRVVAALKRAAFQGMHVETYGYQLSPEYAPRTRTGSRLSTPVIEGYEALNNIRVTVTDLHAVGRVVDTAIGAGANRVASLAFAASHTGAARREALSRAVADARSQAEAIAAALGHELGPPLEISTNAQPNGPVRPMMFSAEAAPTTPVEAADQTVSASVTIRFALGPERSGR